MKTPTATPQARPTYRHGDLRQALLDAGVALARDGGPEAVVLREATRRAGVVPNAAYRHYADRDTLFRAVRAVALDLAADAMQAGLDQVPQSRDAAKRARAGLRAIGTAYLAFAQREPGLFRTAFGAIADQPATSGPPPGPFLLLGAALDRFVEAGLLSAKRRPGAEFLAWSAVHGLALLILDGPCRRLAPAARQALGQRLLDMVEAGIA